VFDFFICGRRKDVGKEQGHVISRGCGHCVKSDVESSSFKTFHFLVSIEKWKKKGKEKWKKKMEKYQSP
jgi:hypothetical protein